MISTDIVVWIGALLTISIISFVYKYNPAFRFAESSGVAVTVGWIVVGSIRNVINLGTTPLSKGNILLIVPLILGLLLFLKFSKTYSYMSRWGAATVAGVGLGISMRGAIETQLVGQIKATSLAIAGVPMGKAFDNIVFLVILLTSFLYFYFTAEHKGSLGTISKIGRYSLMITFGSMYGATVMGRYSLLIARFQFLLLDWLGLG